MESVDRYYNLELRFEETLDPPRPTRSQAPFMLPLPGWLSRAISVLFRLVLKKERSQDGWDLILAFAMYRALI